MTKCIHCRQPSRAGHCGNTKYLVWDEGGREDAVPVCHVDPEYAATEWAERNDADGDYAIVSGSEARVSVEDPEGEVTVWIVRGETVPSYSAEQVETATVPQ